MEKSSHLLLAIAAFVAHGTMLCMRSGTPQYTRVRPTVVGQQGAGAGVQRGNCAGGVCQLQTQSCPGGVCPMPAKQAKPAQIKQYGAGAKPAAKKPAAKEPVQRFAASDAKAAARAQAVKNAQGVGVQAPVAAAQPVRAVDNQNAIQIQPVQNVGAGVAPAAAAQVQVGAGAPGGPAFPHDEQQDVVPQTSTLTPAQRLQKELAEKAAARFTMMQSATTGKKP